MAAAVCGNKRSFFEDIPSSPPVSKRLRCGSASPSPSKLTPPQLFDRLRALFPHLDPQLLERALEERNDDLDSAIKKLNVLCSGEDEEKSGFNEEMGRNSTPGRSTENENTAASELPSDSSKLPENGAEWVDLFVAEMTSATSMDDAKARASRLLEILEKSIMARAADGAAENLQKENVMMKEHIEALVRENSILKRGVAIQHERLQEYENRNQEVQQLKQLVSQYQEQLRTLEINNYALSMHLKQAQQSSSIPGRFHPDVF
ncbi:Ubiquitin system component Cue [Melia azedarach]|uniref:Ubiquitin system component Cue n=1 Tax=Melia azedarach TaxID=155640 RepID=A0ACC1Y5F7_MELAZ|nr:Ubiquitin system component Cue [Melia azedarach]